jgi:hypothetical protein
MKHELEATGRQAVVRGPPFPTAGALRPIPRMRIEINRGRQAVKLILEPQVAVHKSPMRLDSIQDSLDLHPVRCLREVMVGLSTAIVSESTQGCVIDRGATDACGSCRIGGRRERAHRSLQNHRTVLHKLPHASSTFPFQKNPRPEPLRLSGQLTTDSAEEAHLATVVRRARGSGTNSAN